VIHTVGPVWQGGDRQEDELLARCYRSCLALAAQHDLRSLAFPSISTGAYGFPIERAAKIAINQIKQFLNSNSSLERVVIVCFGHHAYQCYLNVLSETAEN
jgi:O-acetyl-ADP-ribose deacetylase (regulator of RNase III)